MIKFFSVLLNIIIFLLFIFVGLLLVMPFFGFRPYAVISGSMIPTLPVGALVVDKVVEPETIIKGDIITFNISGETSTVATHRVVNIDEEKEEFTTKGDNNKDVDSNPVSFSQLVGKVVFSLPILGYVYYFLGTLFGKVVIGVVFIGLIIISIFLDKAADKKKRNEKVEN